MTTCEYVSAAAPVESGQRSEQTSFLDSFISQLFDIIFDLTKHRQSELVGWDWALLDTALRSLHGAIVALEEVSSVEPINERTHRYP